MSEIMEAERTASFRPVIVPLQYTDKGRGYG
jgi:hypothetical protein